MTCPSVQPGTTATPFIPFDALFFCEITEAFARGDRAEIRGFGSFSTVLHDARTGRNPRTGEAMAVDEKRVIRFKLGKGLRDRLNLEGGARDGKA